VTAPALILASGSRTRADMLAKAGVMVSCIRPDVDEGAIKAAAAAVGAGVGETVVELAMTKAQAVARRGASGLVLGADQILEIDGLLLDKPRDRDDARAQLMGLRGRTHRLVTAAAVVEDGALVWTHVCEARLTMRMFSEGFLESYLDAVGPAVLESVGAYHIEGLGSQLFSAVEGDLFTILGLPLLPLLSFLRDRKVVAE
jgi:septum formation protein